MNYPDSLNIGVREVIIGAFFFMLHGVFDFLDSYTEKPLSTNFDILDSIFATLGLVIILFGIIKAARMTTEKLSEGG